jgi:steroid delta-isomerase-like uncharacterized protein
MHDADSLIQIYADAFSRGDVDAVCACFSPKAVIHDLLDGTLTSARVAWAELISSFHIQLRIDALCIEGSVVVARYREQGKFVAPFRGFSPTGRSYEVTAIHWFEIEDGKIVRRWGARNTASIGRQIGIGHDHTNTD